MNTLDILKYGDSFFIETLEGLKKTDEKKPGACGIWSAKDIVAHIASYEQMLVDVLNSTLSKNSKTPFLDQAMSVGPENINDYWVDKSKKKSYESLLNDYKKAHLEVIMIAKKIPKSKWNKNGILPWYGKEYSLNDYIVYQYYGHKREHGAQINAFKDLLKK